MSDRHALRHEDGTVRLYRNDDLQHEWEAWRTICARLEDVGIQINDHDKLADAIKSWGEALVTLRVEASDPA